MKRMLKIWMTIFCTLGIYFPTFAQIDLSDSTAVVMAHWQLQEEQNFKVSYYKKSTEEEKLISSEAVDYRVKVLVEDATEVGYILEWTRTDFQVTTDDKLEKALHQLTADLPFLILTDEFGSSVQSLNWEDIGTEIKQRCEKLKTQYADAPEKLKKIDRYRQNSSTKEQMELHRMLDIQQYLAFHGAKYKLGERIDLHVQVPNNYGGDPLDANATLIMDEMNLMQNTVIIRSSQRVNPYQLTAVTYDYLKSLHMAGAELPAFADFPTITKLEWGGSEIHVNSGWVIYSVETKQTNNDKVVTVEERSIELRREVEK